MARAALLAAGLLLSACDWDLYALLNSIPVHGDPRLNPEVRVYLGIDGLSYATLQDALAVDTRARRSFASGWHAAELVSMFPATSDASWSRILHASRMYGYEYQYYDPRRDSVSNRGVFGVAVHAVPELRGTRWEGPAYYDAFDYHANGYLDTLWSYQATDMDYGDTLDNVFYLLGMRSEVATTFAAYVLELDVMGHMQTREDVIGSFLALWRRIESFKRRHPERRFYFTLFSDHALDFIPAAREELVDFAALMPALGIKPVYSMADGRRSGQLFAVPIVHTRVSYLAMHTEPAMAEEVARLSSLSPAVDVALARAAPRADIDPTGSLAWFAVWRGGERLVAFGHDPARDLYCLPAEGRYAELDVPLSVPGNDSHVWRTDEELFELLVDRRYPDLFFRARTALAPVSVEFPAEVLLSFRRPYASTGFKIPGGANEIASAGFHGGLDAAGSVGVVLTEERELPYAVRSDNLLDLFPALREHVTERGMDVSEGDPGAALDYRQ